MAIQSGKSQNSPKSIKRENVFDINWFRKVKCIWRAALLIGTGSIWVK